MIYFLPLSLFQALLFPSPSLPNNCYFLNWHIRILNLPGSPETFQFYLLKQFEDIFSSKFRAMHVFRWLKCNLTKACGIYSYRHLGFFFVFCFSLMKRGISSSWFYGLCQHWVWGSAFPMGWFPALPPSPAPDSSPHLWSSGIRVCSLHSQDDASDLLLSINLLVILFCYFLKVILMDRLPFLSILSILK